MKTQVVSSPSHTGFSHATKLWEGLPDEHRCLNSGRPHIILYDHLHDALNDKEAGMDPGAIRIIVCVDTLPLPEMPHGIFGMLNSPEDLMVLISILRPGEEMD
ncbi:hypothetical protein N9L18_01000 [Candidatus Pacebacteria bacterium]|nr:hypothetical protein [Candidatus Paceibacterota bacterium]